MSSLLRLCLCIGAVTLVALGSEEAKPAASAEDTPPAPAPEGGVHEDGDGTGSDNDGLEGEEDEAETKVALPAEAEQMAGLVEKIDTDKDGKMSMPEIIAFWKITRKGMLHQNKAQDMELMDTDKDNKVSLEEFMKKEEDEFLDAERFNELEPGVDDARRKSFEELHGAKFKAADMNADGFLDEHELPHAVYGETHDEIVRIMAAHDLKKKDKDGDGKLDATEFNELKEDPKVGDADAQMPEDEAESEKELAEEFKKQDTDGDGKLDLDEIVHWESGVFHITVDMQRLFEACDKDKDSHITLKELNDNLHDLDGFAASDHLNEWAEHHESMLEHHGEL